MSTQKSLGLKKLKYSRFRAVHRMLLGFTRTVDLFKILLTIDPTKTNLEKDDLLSAVN
jgi:hypothetical protein